MMGVGLGRFPDPESNRGSWLGQGCVSVTV